MRYGRAMVHSVNFGLGWMRRRQRSLTGAVLAMFCAAWLQAAVVPCVMAHGTDLASAGAATAPDAHRGHEHTAGAGAEPSRSASQPCLYCPPDETATGHCELHGGCAYPHDPQVDARAAGALFTALPVSYVVMAAPVCVRRDGADRAIAPAPPRVSLSVSYCRFIE